MGHKPGRLADNSGHSRALDAQRPAAMSDLTGPVAVPSIIQAGALASVVLTEETSNGLTMTTWSRMTTEAAKTPHQTATGL
jgi:hypothetical protein